MQLLKSNMSSKTACSLQSAFSVNFDASVMELFMLSCNAGKLHARSVRDKGPNDATKESKSKKTDNAMHGGATAYVKYVPVYITASKQVTQELVKKLKDFDSSVASEVEEFIKTHLFHVPASELVVKENRVTLESVLAALEKHKEFDKKKKLSLYEIDIMGTNGEPNGVILVDSSPTKGGVTGGAFQFDGQQENTKRYSNLITFIDAVEQICKMTDVSRPNMWLCLSNGFWARLYQDHNDTFNKLIHLRSKIPIVDVIFMLVIIPTTEEAMLAHESDLMKTLKIDIPLLEVDAIKIHNALDSHSRPNDYSSMIALAHSNIQSILNLASKDEMINQINLLLGNKDLFIRYFENDKPKDDQFKYDENFNYVTCDTLSKICKAPQ